MMLVNLLLSLSLLSLNTGLARTSESYLTKVNDYSDFSSEVVYLSFEKGQFYAYPASFKIKKPVNEGVVGKIDESILISLIKDDVKPEPTLIPVVEQPKPSIKKSKTVVTKKPSSQKIKPVKSSNIYINSSAKVFESYVIDQCTLRGCNPEQLLRVMNCESKGNVNAYNPNGSTYGLMQFQRPTFIANANRIGITNLNIYDPYQQIQVAAYMFANGQAWQWTCK